MSDAAFPGAGGAPAAGLPLGGAGELLPVPGLEEFLPRLPTLGEALLTAPDWYRDALLTAGPCTPGPGSSPAVDPSRLAALLDGLAPEERTAFWLVGTFNAGRGIPVEQCWAVLAEATGQRHRRFSTVLDSLRRRGLVVVGHHNYRTVYFIPAEIRAAAEDPFFRPAAAAAALDPASRTPLSREATAMRDLHVFLLAASRGEISLTRQGDIHRRQQLRLARMLGWPARPAAGHEEGDPALARYSPPGPAAPRNAFAPREDVLAARLSLLWGYALHRGLVAPDEPAASLDSGVDGWLELDWGQRWVDVVGYLLRRELSWTPDLFSVLQLLTWCPAGTWLPLRRVPLQGDRPSALPASFQALGQAVHALEYLGLLEQAEESPADSGPAVRLTELGRAFLEALFAGRGGIPRHLLPRDERSFLVGPNFELVAPFNLHPRLVLGLGAMADLVQADQALLFRITRESVYHALRRGMDGEGMLALLRQGNHRPLPQNVEASIREWSEAYGRVWLARFHLLRCRDAEVAARLKASPRLQPLLAGELTPRDLILREGSLERVREALEKEGLMPHARVEVAPLLEEGEPAPVPPGPRPAAPPGGAPRGVAVPPIRVQPLDWLDLTVQRFQPSGPPAPRSREQSLGRRST